MPIEIQFDDDEAQKRLLKAAHIFLDLRPFWPMVNRLFIGWMRRQFESEGGYASGGWAKLSPDYAAWKAVRYPGKGILIAEGKLRKAASMPRRTSTPNMLTLRIVDPKVGWHQQGTDRMPARPLIFGEDNMPADARHELQQAAKEYVERALRAV